MSTPNTTDRQTLRLPMDDAELVGDLAVPADVRGVMVFAHGSGSSRRSPRNRAVATALNTEGMATLLIDLLTADEEARDELTGEHRFDIPLLARRLVAAVDWTQRIPTIAGLPLGLFGASTGAAAALVAAVERPERVAAVVCRGGRPDLAGAALAKVRAPVLMIVGSHDPEVLELNQAAAARMDTRQRIEIVQGAGHLFAEPGTLAAAGRLAADWAALWFGVWTHGDGGTDSGGGAAAADERDHGHGRQPDESDSNVSDGSGGAERDPHQDPRRGRTGDTAHGDAGGAGETGGP